MLMSRISFHYVLHFRLSREMTHGFSRYEAKNGFYKKQKFGFLRVEIWTLINDKRKKSGQLLYIRLNSEVEDFFILHTN